MIRERMKEITHEKARKLVSKIEYKSLLQKDLYDYIKQQEIKGWLLDLYRDRFSFYNFDEDSDLRKIKVLEEELK